VGERFEIRVSQFGIPIFWVGEWEMVQPNSALVDVGIRCPFAFWKHEHLFEPHGEHTRMTDRVQLTPKGGWFALQIGRPFLFLFLKKMFQDRHVATRRYFERKSKPGP
jgi:ligand-binding SRPBCC domain-containing protein